MNLRLHPSSLLLVLPALLLGCTDTSKLKGSGCQEDRGCGDPASAFRCETQTGVCYCRTNQGCQPSEFCNTAGFCQDRAGCEKNSDCLGSDLFCDTTTGTCLSLGRCTIDLHCALGQVCDIARSTCVTGCRMEGDCQGMACRCGDAPCECAGKTQAELQKCTLGVCDPGICADDSICAFGQVCAQMPDSGIALKQCFSDYDERRRPYCSNCTFGGGTQVCGSGPNFCLIDTAHPGNFFCGADCSEAQTCPRGYRCSDVIVVGTAGLPACTRANPTCPVNRALSCVADSECPRGGVCAKEPGQANGFCAGKCSIDEGEDNGFCPCMVDGDCAQETCSAGECSISRRACVNDGDCRTIHCVDFQGGGGCLIGQNCAPSDGLSCLEVQ